MITWIISAIIIILILALATYVAIWSRRPTNARLISILALIPLSLLGVGATGVVLGNPSVCFSGYNIPDGKLDVLGFKVIKNDRIWLMLDTGGREPFTCSVPYNNQKAEMLEGNKRSGKKSQLNTKGSGTLGQGIGMPPDGIILPAPVAPLPDKPGDTSETIELQ